MVPSNSLLNSECFTALCTNHKLALTVFPSHNFQRCRAHFPRSTHRAALRFTTKNVVNIYIAIIRIGQFSYFIFKTLFFFEIKVLLLTLEEIRTDVYISVSKQRGGHNAAVFKDVQDACAVRCARSDAANRKPNRQLKLCCLRLLSFFPPTPNRFDFT